MKDCYCFGLAAEALIGVELPAAVLFADVKIIGVITNAIPHEGGFAPNGFSRLSSVRYYKECTRSLIGRETNALMRRYHHDTCTVGASSIGANLSFLSADSLGYDIKLVCIERYEITRV